LAAAEDDLARNDAIAQDAAFVVDVLEEVVESRDVVGQAASIRTRPSPTRRR
jgi:hypothetical protein